MLDRLPFLAALGLLSASATAARPPAGCYEGHATEIAAALELRDDGRFHYGLSYGALDERAQGRWESDGTSVFLTSDPVTPPRFVLVSEAAAPDGRLHVALDLPRGMDPQYFEAIVTLAGGEAIRRQLGEDGLALELEPAMRVVSVRLLLPVFALAGEPVPVSVAGGREVRFRFEPNDIGTAAFARTPLAIDDANLVLERHGRRIRFSPGGGDCG